MFDVAVIGGGPAGLSAALMLARARRRVLVLDAGEPRNAPAKAVHGLLSRDGVPPEVLGKAAREDLGGYPGVDLREVEVRAVDGALGGFRVALTHGGEAEALRLLLATGVVDELPAVPGLAEWWGRGVYHCPYCHGFEVRGQRLAVLLTDVHNVRLAALLTRYGLEVTGCRLPESPVGEQERGLLAATGVEVPDGPVRAVASDDAGVAGLLLADGSRLDCDAVFVHPPTRQRAEFAERLGCRLLEDGSVQVDDVQQTTVPGVYAAGDMARRPSMPLPGAQVSIAAAEGAVAGVALDQDLLAEELAAKIAG